MSESPHVIMLRENAWQSIISDTYSISSALGLIGIGWYIGSTAMQWMGFILFGITMLARSSGKLKRRTPQEAADYLRAEFNVSSPPPPSGEGGK